MKRTIVSKEREQIIIETTQCGSDACPDQLLVQFGVKMFCSTPDELKKLGTVFVEMGKEWEDASSVRHQDDDFSKSDYHTMQF